MVRGSLGSGQALVPAGATPPWLQHIKGERSGNVHVDVENHYVYPGGGQANDFEGDPSPEWAGRPYGFNPNGEFTLPGPMGTITSRELQGFGTITSRALNGFGSAAESTGLTTLPRMRVTADVVSSIGPTVTMAIGAGAGAFLAPQHRATGTIVGALVGGILGLIFSP